MRQLSPQDAQFLYMESEDNLAHVTSIAIFDPSTVPGGAAVRFKDIINHIGERIHVAPTFRRRLVRLPLELDYPYWVDDEYFDLEYHVRHSRLPQPGDWRQFCIHMARYHSRPLDMNRPLWEMYVVEGLGNIDGLPEGCYALASKIHHAAVDGASLVRFYSAMMDIDVRGTPAVPLEVEPAEPSPRPQLSEIVRRAALTNLNSPLRVARTLARSAPGVYEAVRGAASGPKASVPSTRFNARVSPHKVFDAVEFPLDDLKRMRALAPGCKINDVVLAICSGALRRYLQHHDELPDQSLVAWVPINARPGGAQDTSAPGNNIAAMTAAIHTDVEDAVARLTAIHHSTQRSKEAKSGLSARLMTDITRHVPAATQVLASRLVLATGAAARVCNLFVSNVPGPQLQLYMNGARQLGSFGLAPLGDGMGLFIAAPSYNGRMSFSVISTREILPDIAFFVDCLRAAHAELFELAQADTAAGSRQRKKSVTSKGSAKKKRASAVAATAKKTDTAVRRSGSGENKTRQKKAAPKSRRATQAKVTPKLRRPQNDNK